MRPSRLILSAVLLTLAVSANAALTGTWSGTFTASAACRNGSTVPVSGPVTLSIVDFPTGPGARTPFGPAGADREVTFNAAGTINAGFPDFETCQMFGSTAIPMFLFGAEAGSSVTADLLLPTYEFFEVSGSLSGQTLTLSGPGDEGGSVSLTVTRTSVQPPDYRYAGDYAGSYTFNADYSQKCADVGIVSSSGAAAGFFAHIGIGGFLFLELSNFEYVYVDDTGCTEIDFGPDGFALLALTNVNGNNINGFIDFLGEYIPFTGSINGNTISGTAPLPGGAFTFNVNKTSMTPSPHIDTFTADPVNIQAGQSSTLRWATRHADSVTIDNGVGVKPAIGSVVVSPTVTTVYTLVATGPGGTTQSRVTVTVSQPTARVVVGSLPRGFVQPAGQGGGTDTFTLSNLGDAPTTVTLTPSGDYFTVTPTSFSLAPGASQTVTITGLAKPAGAYESGTISVTGAGVPSQAVITVRMLSAAPPTGTTQPRATTSREEVSSAPGENPTGTVEFTNSGSSTVTAIAVSDVPWIVPQAGVITIPPGQTVSVSYMIDSSKRPDGGAGIGAATGKISLVFISGSSSGPVLAGAGSSTSTISVTLVHVAKPSVSAGTPPPLAAGEIALFVSGLANRPTATGDLLLANRLSTPLTGLQLFVQGANAPSLSAGISQLVANSSVQLPGLMKNVFNSAVPSGTAQIRGAAATQASVAAIQTNTSTPEGTYSTALPVFRSDRSIVSSDAVLLSGLQKSTTAQTNLFVQETSGNTANYTVEFLDSRGTVVSARATSSIAPFGFAELFDAAPAGAISARVTNSSGAGRMSAYALVTNPTTGDSWLVTDPSAGSPTNDAFIIPIFSAGTGAETALYITNRRNTAATSISIDVRSSMPARRRAVGRGSSATPPMSVAPDAVTTTTLSPAETTVTPLTAGSGYVRVSGPAGAVSTVGRSVRTTGGSAFGTGLPAVSVASALRSGQIKRFAGVEDASTASKAAAVPATFRTNLALVETHNASVTVRLSLQFSFSGGSLVSSTARVSKDYSLSAGQYLLLLDVGRELIGGSRESFGDLRNMTLDVEVVSGSGGVIPFIQAVDNGSGDTLVRIE